jgi:hypothetical protein
MTCTYAADYTGSDLFACTNNYQELLSLFSYVNMLWTRFTFFVFIAPFTRIFMYSLLSRKKHRWDNTGAKRSCTNCPLRRQVTKPCVQFLEKNCNIKAKVLSELTFSCNQAKMLLILQRWEILGEKQCSENFLQALRTENPNTTKKFRIHSSGYKNIHV